jgi:hypothetical protein
MNIEKQTIILEDLHRSIYTKFTMIDTDIKKIFKKYEYNKGRKLNSNTSYDNKLVKHQPKQKHLSFDNVKFLFKKNISKKGSNNVSYTVLNKNICEIKKYIKNTILRRINTFMYFHNIENKKQLIASNIILKNNVELGLTFRNDLNKYEGTEITQDVMELNGHINSCFDIVYKIKTENPHCFILMDDETNQNFLCEYILICIKNKKYNIMFHSTKALKINDIQSKILYNTIDNLPSSNLIKS